MRISNAYMWGVPGTLWALSLVIEGPFFPLLLLIWWSFFQTFVGPLVFVVGPVAMYLATKNWDDSWTEYLTRTEIWSTAVIMSGFGGFSYYLFWSNWTEALLYYDEVLQERHEEIIQFGEPKDDVAEEEEDQTATF